MCGCEPVVECHQVLGGGNTSFLSLKTAGEIHLSFRDPQPARGRMLRVAQVVPLLQLDLLEGMVVAGSELLVVHVVFGTLKRRPYPTTLR